MEKGKGGEKITAGSEKRAPICPTFFHSGPEDGKSQGLKTNHRKSCKAGELTVP